MQALAEVVGRTKDSTELAALHGQYEAKTPDQAILAGNRNKC
jgi:hypothetical protein